MQSLKRIRKISIEEKYFEGMTTAMNLNRALFCPQCESIFQPTSELRACPSCTNRFCVALSRRRIPGKGEDEANTITFRGSCCSFPNGAIVSKDSANKVSTGRVNVLIDGDYVRAQSENPISYKIGVCPDGDLREIFGGLDIFRKLFQRESCLDKILSRVSSNSMANLRSGFKRIVRSKDFCRKVKDS